MVIIMAKSIINAGVCGFCTTVDVQSEDQQMATVTITTECPSRKPLEQESFETDGFSECFGKPGDGEAYNWCKQYCIHAACPVPIGIVKTVEVACELALPRNVSFEIEK